MDGGDGVFMHCSVSVARMVVGIWRLVMSLDFPNREDWLAYRKPRPDSARYIHVSGFGKAARIANAVQFGTAPGQAYNVGRNKMKRKWKAL